MIKFSGNFNPDPVWHRHISFAKSVVRIVAGAALAFAGVNDLVMAGGILLIVAEVLGIIEEIV